MSFWGDMLDEGKVELHKEKIAHELSIMAVLGTLNDNEQEEFDSYFAEFGPNPIAIARWSRNQVTKL